MNMKCVHNSAGFCKLNTSYKCPYDGNEQLDCEDYTERCVANDTKVPIEITCIVCGKTYAINVEPYKLATWRQSGMRIQDAFPDMSADERELILSGICGKCYDEMFKTDEED